MKPDKFPRLTPLRAFDLLRALDQRAHYLAGYNRDADDRTREALANHVKNAIVARRRARS